MMKNRKKILIVCFADSPHSQSWIDLIDSSKFDVRVFAYPKDSGDKYPHLHWSKPTYTLRSPHNSRNDNRIYSFLPSNKIFNLVSLILSQYNKQISWRWLKWIIWLWRPSIVHSLSFRMGGFITFDALIKIPQQRRPKWIISSWGTEINYGSEESSSKEKISSCLKECDWFIADCNRDIGIAKSLGLPEYKLAFNIPVPGAGGVDVNQLSIFKKDVQERKIILIPKAYESSANKTLPILEALNICGDILDSYEIYLLMCSDETKQYLKHLSPKLQSKCHCLPMIPKNQFLKLLGSARLMIAPSLSDGTPNVLLETMAMGAFPIMSPISSILEWIIDGKNGLLAHALFPDQIAYAIKKAINDDNLITSAEVINYKIILQRACRENIKIIVNNFYYRV